MSPPLGAILVIDDDADIRAALRDILADHGFTVTEAATGKEAKDLVQHFTPDLILLDLGLPDLSGLDVLTELTATSGVPVIVVTARSGEADTVVGLDLGAEDYIVKPFRERELIARVKAALRRRRESASASRIMSGSLMIDEMTHDVVIDGRSIELTPREFSLLTFLASAPRQVFSRRQLLEQVWGSSPSWQDDSTIGEHIYRIRRKLDPDDRSRWIETVRGVGYRFAGHNDGVGGQPD